MLFRSILILSFVYSSGSILNGNSVAFASGSKPEVWAFLPLSGENGIYGERINFIYRVAYEEEVSSMRWDLKVIDYRSQIDILDSLCRLSASRKEVIGWIGGVGDDASKVIAHNAEEWGIPFIIDNAWEDSLTIGYRNWVFRISPPVSEHNDGLVSWAVSVAGSSMRLAILFSTESVFQPLMSDLRHDLTVRWTGEIKEVAFSPGQKSWNNVISDLRFFHPALVWILGNTGDAARFVKACREERYYPYAFVFGDRHITSRRIISLAEGAADWSFGVSLGEPWKWSDVGLKFAHKMRALTGREPQAEETFAYATVQILANFFNRTTENQMREGLKEFLEDLVISTPAGEVRFETYQGYTHQNRVRTITVQLIDGEWKSVWPKDLALNRYRYPTPDWKERVDDVQKRMMQNRRGIFLLITTTILLILLIFRRRQITRI
ncbi:MAG: ABC transporter substrate-binding protein, partial [bacterium]